MPLTFTVFADLHYKYGMYAASVADLETILSRAHADSSELIVHCGDFSNDYPGSPEVWSRYLNDSLPVYGVYGNHELEASGSQMSFVTPRLSNDPSILFGTQSGGMEDGYISYGYVDRGAFRLIFLDTNHSYNETEKKWEHNHDSSFTFPRGNIKGYSLGPDQLSFLSDVIRDAEEQKRHCLLFSHDSFSGIWGTSPDGEAVRELYRRANEKTPGTVILSVNGHYHTDHATKKDGVVYFDVNSAINGYWTEEQHPHYGKEHTFPLSAYDDDGALLSTELRPLSDLSMAIESYFFESPLSAQITVTEDGHVSIRGTKTSWRYGIVPPVSSAVPYISDASF